jgi:Domain of unknown function (DUF3786)
MPGLIDLAGGGDETQGIPHEQTRAGWEEGMLAQLDRLRTNLRLEPPSRVVRRCGAEQRGSGLGLVYWGDDLTIEWPDLVPFRKDGTPLSTFDCAMILYYMSRADGQAPTGEWIGFRELPSGGFYHQAFQAYSGDPICREFEANPEALASCAAAIGGWPVAELGDHAFAFQPLPLIRIAVVLWLGDDEVASRATVLFDSSASHHHPTDGLALLGSGLTRRLLALAKHDRASTES